MTHRSYYDSKQCLPMQLVCGRKISGYIAKCQKYKSCFQRSQDETAKCNDTHVKTRVRAIDYCDISYD